MVLITKGSQGISEYMPNQVTNTTESFNYNFKCISIAKIANVLYETKLFLRQVICSFLGFIDNLDIILYKKCMCLSSCNGT